jgi:ABC-type glycerol-3-phosphate transport system substrate-binding protein
MKNVVVGAVSAVLLFAMGMSIVACNVNGKNKGEKISADSVWYDTDIYKINLGIDTTRDVDQTAAWIAGTDDENMVVVTKGRYKMPASVRTLEEASAYVIAKISVLDKKNNTLVKTIDLNDEITAADDINSTELEDGKLKINISSYDMKTYSVKTIEKVLDIASGKVTETNDYSLGTEHPSDKTFKVGGYEVDTFIIWSGNGSSSTLAIYSPEGDIKKTALEEPGADIYDIPTILPLDETTALVAASTNNGIKFYSLDLKEGKIKDADPSEYEWIDADDLRETKTVNGGIYYSTPLGLYKVDIEKKATEMVLDYGRCDLNRSLLASLEITEIEDGTYVLCGQKDYGMRYDANLAATEFYIVKLTKAAKNPHAGKTVLDLFAPYGQVGETINEAILKFNKTNKDYFIELTNKYESVDYDDLSEIDSEDEYENITLNKGAKMSSRLAMDIMNGEGPDILMNTSTYGQLNNDNYLVDLSSYFNDLDENKYFTNLIEAAKTDGKLYQMPVCYTIDGIFTDRKNAGSSGVGFTTEEYQKFISGTLNGQDLITSGQSHYFAKLFSAMSDRFIKDGKADFSGDDFKVLADYVKDNIPEKAPSWSSNEGPEINNKAAYISCYAMSGYFYELEELQGDLTVLGIPSTDGRGPMIQAYTSLGVSSQASNVSACIEFIKTVLSDEIQEELAMEENYVLNREAFHKGGMAAVEYYNGPKGDMIFGFDHMTGEPLKNRIKFSEKDIDNLESVISSCSAMYTEDQAINIILIEEMPAYFLGQKDLDSVIKITQDRVQKVLDERK